MISDIVLVSARLRESEVASLVDVFGHHEGIFPVMLPKDFPGAGVAINRVFHETEDSNVHSVVTVTAFAGDFDRVEKMGEAACDALRDGAEPWSYIDVEDVQFEKVGPDFTGWDPVREQFFRSIHFEVRW